MVELLGEGDDAVLDPFQGGAEGTFGEIGGDLGGGGVDVAVVEFFGDQGGFEGVEAYGLGAAADGGEEGFGLIGEEDDERAAERFLEGFEEAVLGGGVHQVGLFDDEDLAVPERGFEAGGGGEGL